MKFYVTIKDSYGKNLEIEVSYEIYKLFDDERKMGERERNEFRRHCDCRELNDYFFTDQTASIEEQYILKEKPDGVNQVLKTCTPVQRERFYLNRVCRYSYTKIAKRYGCGKSHIKSSVDKVIKKIKKYFAE